jgi:hypothetical protein
MATEKCAMALILVVLATGCTSTTSIVPFESTQFEDPPTLTWRDGYVCMTYKPIVDLLHPMVRCQREGENLLFYVYIFISGNPHTGQRQWIELELHDEDLALAGRVFWLDPDGSRHRLRFANSPPEPRPGNGTSVKGPPVPTT